MENGKWKMTNQEILALIVTVFAIFSTFMLIKKHHTN